MALIFLLALLGKYLKNSACPPENQLVYGQVLRHCLSIISTFDCFAYFILLHLTILSGRNVVGPTSFKFGRTRCLIGFGTKVAHCIGRLPVDKSDGSLNISVRFTTQITWSLLNESNFPHGPDEMVMNTIDIII